jgi:hypothetical protein
MLERIRTNEYHFSKKELKNDIFTIRQVATPIPPKQKDSFEMEVKLPDSVIGYTAIGNNAYRAYSIALLVSTKECGQF